MMTTRKPTTSGPTTSNPTSRPMTRRGPATNRRSAEPTHDVFDVIEVQGRKPFWNRVGAVYDDAGEGQTVVIVDVAGGGKERAFHLVPIDRVRRPIRPFGDPKRFPTHDLIVGEGKANRVGVAFVNRDGSLSLVIDDGVRDGAKARFQMRLRREPRQHRSA